MTREERNVLIFLAVGWMLGSWLMSGRDGTGEASVPANGPADGSSGVVVTDLFPIDLNRASAELLTELPGIGPAKAAAIVARREKAGPFGAIEELAEVRGIGPKTVQRLRDRVTVGDEENRERGNHRLGERPTGSSPDGERGPHLGADGAGEEPGEVQR